MRFCRASLALALALGWGCDNPQPALLEVQPAQGYSDTDVRLLLLGRDFIPATILDPQTGRRIATSDGFSARIGGVNDGVTLDRLDWLATGALSVWLPSVAAQRLPARRLDVTVTDPRGRTTTLSGGFTELGPDRDPPALSFDSPANGTGFPPGAVVRGSFSAVKAAPATLVEVGWLAYENGNQRGRAICPLTPGQNEIDCGFAYTLSNSLDERSSVRIVAYALDSAQPGNRGEASLSLGVLPRPVLSGITPSEGGTAGGTDVIVTGAGFVDGTQVLVDGDLLFPDGGRVVGPTLISGRMPAHAAGTATVSVRTPSGDALGTRAFTYSPPPRIDTIVPAVGSAAGGTAVTVTGAGFAADTKIYFGATLDGAQPLSEFHLQNDTSIVGRAPAGSGTTTVWAASDTLGFTKLTDGFAWSAP